MKDKISVKNQEEYEKMYNMLNKIKVFDSEMISG